jgi:hypothetical protein
VRSTCADPSIPIALPHQSGGVFRFLRLLNDECALPRGRKPLPRPFGLVANLGQTLEKTMLSSGSPLVHHPTFPDRGERGTVSEVADTYG